MFFFYYDDVYDDRENLLTSGGSSSMKLSAVYVHTHANILCRQKNPFMRLSCALKDDTFQLAVC